MSMVPARVAIVDDDPSVRRALGRLLRAHGYDAVTHDSGPALLAALPSDRPACLIVDQQMPGMTGLELHARLVAAGLGIPVIIVTAHDAAELRQRCVAAGIAGYHVKPLDRHVIVAAIEEALAAAGPGALPGGSADEPPGPP